MRVSKVNINVARIYLIMLTEIKEIKLEDIQDSKFQTRLDLGDIEALAAVSYTHLTLPTTPYV